MWQLKLKYIALRVMSRRDIMEALCYRAGCINCCILETMVNLYMRRLSKGSINERERREQYFYAAL